MNMAQEILQRIKAPTPIFWKKVRNVAIYVGGGALTIMTMNSQMNLELNSTLIEICKYVMVAAAAVGGSATMTSQNHGNEK